LGVISLRKKKECRVKHRQEKIAEWARQMGVSDESLQGFLQEAAAGESSVGEISDAEREEALIEAERLKELGTIEEQQSRYGEALKCYGAALEIFRAHANRTGEGKVLGNLGLVYRAQEQYELAIAHHTQALAIAREIGDKRIEGSHLGNLGIVYQAQGKYELAIGHFTRSIAIAREIGVRRTEGMQLGNLGLVYQAQGQHDQAIAHYNESITIAREIGDKRIEGSQLGNLGNVYQAQGQYHQAVEHCTQSIAIAREIGIKRTEGIQLGNLGDALFELEQYDGAEAAFRQAIAIGNQTFPAAAGAFSASLALLLAKQGKLDEAQALLEVGEPQVEARPEEHAKFLCKKGQVCHMAGDAEGARAALVQAQAVATELKVTDHSAVCRAIAELAAKGTGPWADQQQEVQCDNHDMDAEGDDRKQRFQMAFSELKAQKE
jgi:tetratricopeptide (TPR) repeat protein